MKQNKELLDFFSLNKGMLALENKNKHKMMHILTGTWYFLVCNLSKEKDFLQMFVKLHTKFSDSSVDFSYLEQAGFRQNHNVFCT